MKTTWRPSVSFSVRYSYVLMIAKHKRWSTLLLCSVRVRWLGGGLVCEWVGKADLLTDHFDSKQSRESVNLPLTCHPSLSLTTFAFGSREVRRLLLDLEPYSGTDPLGIFHFFLKRTDVLAPHLSVVFRRRVWVVSLLGEDEGKCHPYSEGSTVLLCCQLLTNLYYISIVESV